MSAAERQTAFQDAFASAGLHARDYALASALARFREMGGMVERARELTEFAFKELPGSGHGSAASEEAKVVTPASRQPLEVGGGHRLLADKATQAAPPPTSFKELPGADRSRFVGNGLSAGVRPGQANAGAADHRDLASKAECAVSAAPTAESAGADHITDVGSTTMRVVSPPAPPARTRRGLVSIAATQSTIKQGLLELKKTSDGRSWGAVGWHELDGMDRDGAIARMIRAKANPPRDKHAPLRSVLSNKLFEEICDAAQKQNDFV